MVNKRWIIPFLFAVAAAAQPLEAGVTLGDAVRKAWELSPAVQRQLQGEAAARIGLKYALSRRYFRLEAGGSYRFTTDAVGIKAEDFPLLPPDLDIPPGYLILSAPNESYDLKLSLVQPIYTGGAIRQAIKAEEIRELMERRRTEMVRVELAGQVRSSFLTFRFLLAKRQSLNRLLDTLGLHLKKIEAFVREDLVRRSDLLETRTRLDEVRLGLEDLVQQVEQERIVFIGLCGFDPETVEAVGLESSGSYEQSWEAFLDGHPLLAAFQEQERLVEAGRRAAAASRRPQLAGAYELHYGKPGLNFFKNEWRMYVQAGLTLNIPLVNRGESDRDIALSVVEGRKLDSQRQAFLQEAERGLKQLYQLKKTLAAKRTLTEGLVRDAEEDARLKESLYRESQISNLDYLAAVSTAEKYRSLRDELDVQDRLADVRIAALIGRTGAEQ